MTAGIVCALVGAFVGASVSMAVMVTSARAAASDADPSMAFLADLVRPTTRLFGNPFVIASGNGPAVLDIGPRPEGATELFVSLGCLSEGMFTTSIDDSESRTTYYCGEGRIIGSGVGTPLASGPHTVTVDGAGEYRLWASWTAPAPPALTSAEQSAAVGDGTVTETEYRDAFGRFQRCMADARYPLTVVDPTANTIKYTYSADAYRAGIDATCYDAEFRQVDSAWRTTQARQ